MNSLFFFFTFIFGTIIGSFLNVVILRFHTGRGVSGRSGCFSCGHTLSSLELIPIVSFLLLKGKCKNCHAKISPQYPIVEALTGLLFCVLASSSGVTISTLLSFATLALTLDMIIWSVLMVITVYDLKHMIIPDVLSGLFALLTGLKLLLVSFTTGTPSHVIVDHLVSAFVLSGFFFALWLISKGRWIGLGDSKLAFGMGLYLGLAVGLSAFAYAFWIGASVALLRIAYERVIDGKRGVTMKSEIPFAPFLIVGTLLAFILQTDVFHVEYFLL